MNLFRKRSSTFTCHVLHASLFCLYFGEVTGFLGRITNGLKAVGDLYCNHINCCDFHLNDKDDAIHLLQIKLNSKLYGQPLASKLIFDAFRSHLQGEPVKALAIGMHGSTGTGKNYAGRMIAESIFRKGMKSPIVHVFAGKGTFPADSDVDIYKKDLVNWISGNVSKCAHSMFIFDECDRLPPTLLDVVMPFIDHHATFGGVDYRHASFVFLTNNGGMTIKDRLLELYENGNTREKLKMMDFHDHVAISLFNEEGGFYMSDVIRGDGIDFYIPFLPLEEKHVRLCIIDELLRRGSGYKADDIIREVIKNIQFGPEDHPIFSVNGCKRVHSLVINALSGKYRRVMKIEL